MQNMNKLPLVATLTIPEPVREEFLGGFVGKITTNSHTLVEYSPLKGAGQPTHNGIRSLRSTTDTTANSRTALVKFNPTQMAMSLFLNIG